MGLSQGYAASTIATMLWNDEPFAVVVGMCGYLPFRKSMHEVADGAGAASIDSEADDVSKRDGDEQEGGTAIAKALQWLRDELGIDIGGDGIAESYAIQSMPAFLAHRIGDQKMPVVIGKSTAGFLKDIEVGATWKEYESLGH
jgi:hypothetical protein